MVETFDSAISELWPFLEPCERCACFTPLCEAVSALSWRLKAGRTFGAGGLVWDGRGDYSLLTFSVLPLLWWLTGLTKAPAPSQSVLRLPRSPSLTWPAFLAYRGSSPWLPLHSRPPQNQSLVIPQQTRLMMHETSHSRSAMDPITMGTAQDSQWDVLWDGSVWKVSDRPDFSLFLSLSRTGTLVLDTLGQSLNRFNTVDVFFIFLEKTHFWVFIKLFTFLCLC